MLDCKQLLVFPQPIPYGSDHYVLVNRSLCRNTGNKNLQIKRKDHILNHQTNDVLVTEKRKKKIDQSKNKNDCQNRTKHNNLLDAFRFNLKQHQWNGFVLT